MAAARSLLALDEPFEAAPYRGLVRVRLWLGWSPEEATVLPYRPKARLTPAQAEQVRTSKASAEELATQLGVSARHVRRIRAGLSWKAA